MINKMGTGIFPWGTTEITGCETESKLCINVDHLCSICEVNHMGVYL